MEELTLMEILQLVCMVEVEVEDADLSEEPTTKEEMEKMAALNYITKYIIKRTSVKSRSFVFYLLNHIKSVYEW